MRHPFRGDEKPEGVVAVDAILYQIDKVEAAAVALRRLVESLEREELDS
jgi:hypothetical protein